MRILSRAQTRLKRGPEIELINKDNSRKKRRILDRKEVSHISASGIRNHRPGLTETIHISWQRPTRADFFFQGGPCNQNINKKNSTDGNRRKFVFFLRFQRIKKQPKKLFLAFLLFLPTSTATTTATTATPTTPTATATATTTTAMTRHNDNKKAVR